MKTYVLTVSINFPSTHIRKGEETEFLYKIHNELTYQKKGYMLYPTSDVCSKIHTIRANYPLWKKRFEEIEKGEACLSIRYWSDIPYKSKQIEFARLTKEDGIGIEELHFGMGLITVPIVYSQKGDIYMKAEVISENDGLLFEDWKEWFKSYDLKKPMAIIHFTKFRY